MPTTHVNRVGPPQVPPPASGGGRLHRWVSSVIGPGGYEQSGRSSIRKGRVLNKDTTSGAIQAEDLQRYGEAFRADRANRVAANAAVSEGVLKAAIGYEGARSLPREFSVDLKQGSVTNQEHSGRCWMFASLNVLRYEVIHRWKLEDFEFSETYLFFWDKMEKANAYLENVLATLDRPSDDRLVQILNESPADDGGWWEMFANLVNKYGLVPKSAYPESANSRDSGDFNLYLNKKLRQDAIELRRKKAAGAGMDELRELKTRDMETVYRICAIALGEPPATFDFSARVKGDEDEGAKGSDSKKAAEGDSAPGKTQGESGRDERVQIREFGITPMDFYRKYVPVDVNDYVTLCNSPMEATPFNRHYQIAYVNNVAEDGNLNFVNVPLEVLRKAVTDQISAGHPTWFACDCDQFSLRKAGIFDRGTVQVDQLFGTDFSIEKGDGLEYGDFPSNHAMTITGLNLDKEGRPDRWKVENSWGKTNGVDGYYVASAEWFDQFVSEAIVRKEFLDQETLKALASDPVVLQPWQPLTLCSD